VRSLFLLLALYTVAWTVEAAAPPEEAPKTEVGLFLMDDGRYLEGERDLKTGAVLLQGKEIPGNVIYKEPSGGYKPAPTATNNQQVNRLAIMRKEYTRLDEKVQTQATYFEKNFAILPLGWDFLLSTNAKWSVSELKTVGIAATESQMSAQTRDSFALLQKCRKDRAKKANDIVDMVKKLEAAK